MISNALHPEDEAHRAGHHAASVSRPTPATRLGTAGREMADHDLLERRLRAPAPAADERQPLARRATETTPTTSARSAVDASPSSSTTAWPAIASAIGHRQERPPAAEHDQVVARLLDVGDDVRREQRRRARLPDGVDEDPQELAPGQRVEARERLVEEEDRRPRAQRERQPNLRLLSPRQLVGARVDRDREVVEVAAGRGRGRSRGRCAAANARWSSTDSSR